jgi:Tol biopolymer transport system component
MIKTRMVIRFGWLCLGLLMAACAQAKPTPAPTATATLTPLPTATPTPRPSPTPTLIPSPTPTLIPKLEQLTTGGCCVQPAWSPDSRQVLFIDKPSANDPVGFYAVDIAAGLQKPPQRSGPVGAYSQDRSLLSYLDKGRTVVERLSSGERWVMPNNAQVAFAPDNQHLSWADSDENSNIPYDQRRSDLYIAKVDGTEATRVARVYGGGFVGWLPGGSKILLSARPSLAVRERTLSVLDLNTQASVKLVTAERISGVSVSRDGTWIVYTITFDADKSRNGIWLQRTDGTPARKIELWGAYQWRDDGRLLVIPARASADRAFEIVEVDAATGKIRKLTEAAVTPLQILNGDWRVSPDGRYIVYVNSVDRNLWLLKLPPGEVAQ